MEQSRPHAHDHQLIRLQTMPEHGERHGDSNLDVHLTDDLVGEIAPGDRVAVNTKIEVQQKDENSPDFEIYGDADSIDPLESDFSDIDVSEHIDEINEIAENNPVEKIADSILPSHIGDGPVKEAIALQLAGAPDVNTDTNSVRGTIHIFLVGDPGTGKSTALQQVRDIAPRSVFTNGAGSTRAGLTGAAVQDDFGDNGWTVEAGALVEAHNGICAIDELDDMSEEDRAGLLGAMSEQEINLSKAGINATLPANTSVLAAANPIRGRFDPYGESLADQIDVHPALMSRFDLIFTLQDVPEREFDSEVADAINRSTDYALAKERDETPPDADDVTAPIDTETLRAYFAHARSIVPRPTTRCQERIKNDYQRIRQSNDEDGPVPTTPRTLQTLHRLAAAHARLRLSEQYTVEDAKKAFDILMEYLNDVGLDPETGEMDADVIETGQSKSQRDRIHTIQSLLQSMAEEYDRGVPPETLLDRSEEMDIDREKAEQEIEKLKQQGEVYETQGNLHLS